MKSNPPSFRIVVLACSALNCLAIGSCYLYGLFQPYVMEYYGVETSAASLPFTLSWMFMTIAQFLAGPLQKRFGVKFAMVFGLLLMGGGCVGCSLLAPDMIGMLTFLFSVVVGLGMGLAYNTVAATVVRWFPDRRGLASSISIGMMGGAGVLFAPIFGSWLASYGLLASFRNMSLLFVPCILFSIAVFKDVPQGYMADYVPQGVVARQSSGKECRNLRDLVTTRDAWLLVLLYFSQVPTYLIVNAVFVSFGVAAKGIAPQMAPWFLSIASFAQVAGRFIVTGISDRVGRKAVFVGVFSLMAVSVAGIIFGSGVVYAAAFTALSFAYGGGVTSMPAIITDRLGTANATQNIAFAEIGTLLASLASSALMGFLSVGSSIAVSGVSMCLLGAVVVWAIYASKQC